MNSAEKQAPEFPPAGPVSGELLVGDDRRTARLTAPNEQLAKAISLWTDTIFEVPGLGWRFGLDPIIGLIPVAGDVSSALLSLYILSVAAERQVPRSTMMRMALNVAIDCIAGSIPLVGNIFDFAWKANHRNMQLLERTLAAPEERRRRQTIWDTLFVVGILGLVVAMFVGSVALAAVGVVWIGRLLM
jgi:hypothetical protein